MTFSRRMLSAILPLAAIVLFTMTAAAAFAQEDPPPASGSGDPPPAPRRHIVSWTSDRFELREGDIVTVLIDERTAASERVYEAGTERRNLRAELSAKSSGEVTMGATGVDSRWSADSRNVGQADREGDLFGMVTARVVSVESDGSVRIEGSKQIVIDGRKQEVAVAGRLRPNDLSPANVVHSSRLADAAITYKGKKLGAKKGILGSILSILWPF